MAAARAALADAGVAWSDVQFVVGADTIRNGYPGFVAGATYARALGWSGARVASCYAACASGAQAVDLARARILAGLCDVALVVGRRLHPQGLLHPRRRRQAGRSRLAALPPPRRHEPGLLRALTPAGAWPCTARHPPTSPPSRSRTRWRER
ncbi:hypothetical protein GCM10020219_096630 [Nonomuraea dietziae]